MDNTPETAALLAELYERSTLVAELDGPQIEAWASGLFPLFDDDVDVATFVRYCAAQNSVVGDLMCAAIAELTTGMDPVPTAVPLADAPPDTLAQIGTSVLSGAWSVEAPFGRSIMLGFGNSNGPEPAGVDEEPVDLRHSILVEISADGGLEDLQLTGSPWVLLEEAAASDDRVTVTDLDVADALAQVVSAWPSAGAPAVNFGPGFAANQQFVRRRLLVASEQLLPQIAIAAPTVDIRRGLDDDEFAQANKAALSTLQAALRLSSTPDPEMGEPDAAQTMWIRVIRGNAGDLSPRERDALLWLEWADWLGAGIGLVRAGVGADATGLALVDHVNRCPEVSSSIEKSDRDYAEWAFDIALDLLADVDVVVDGRLTQAGLDALGPAMVMAWS